MIRALCDGTAKDKVALVEELWSKPSPSQACVGTENALIPPVSTSTGFENSAMRPSRVSWQHEWCGEPRAVCGVPSCFVFRFFFLVRVIEPSETGRIRYFPVRFE